MKASMRALIAAMATLACASASAQTNASLRTGPGPTREARRDCHRNHRAACRATPIRLRALRADLRSRGGLTRLGKGGRFATQMHLLFAIPSSAIREPEVTRADTFCSRYLLRKPGSRSAPVCYFWNWRAPIDFVQPIHGASTYGGRLTYSTKTTD